jgi:hypothetical protein
MRAFSVVGWQKTSPVNLDGLFPDSSLGTKDATSKERYDFPDIKIHIVIHLYFLWDKNCFLAA